MTPEAQRIAIAESSGWRHHDATRESPVVKGGMRLPNYFENRDSVDAWTHPAHDGVYAEPPRYLTDLNAIHAAVRWRWDQPLGADFLAEYCEVLMDICGGANGAICATPEQCCEAFLKTTGAWKR